MEDAHPSTEACSPKRSFSNYLGQQRLPAVQKDLVGTCTNSGTPAKLVSDSLVPPCR